MQASCGPECTDLRAHAMLTLQREPPNKSYQYLIMHASSDIPLSLHGLFPDQVIQTSDIVKCCDI